MVYPTWEGKEQLPRVTWRYSDFYYNEEYIGHNVPYSGNTFWRKVTKMAEQDYTPLGSIGVVNKELEAIIDSYMADGDVSYEVYMEAVLNLYGTPIVTTQCCTTFQEDINNNTTFAFYVQNFFGSPRYVIRVFKQDDTKQKRIPFVHSQELGGSYIDALASLVGIMFDSQRTLGGYNPPRSFYYKIKTWLESPAPEIREVVIVGQEKVAVDHQWLHRWYSRPPVSESRSWIDITADITSGDRRRDYGHPLTNFMRIAMEWTVYQDWRVVYTPLDVAMMSIVMKVARQINTFKDDNFIDMMGYSVCVEAFDQRMKEMGYAQGAKEFDKWKDEPLDAQAVNLTMLMTKVLAWEKERES